MINLSFDNSPQLRGFKRSSWRSIYLRKPLLCENVNSLMWTRYTRACLHTKLPFTWPKTRYIKIYTQPGSWHSTLYELFIAHFLTGAIRSLSLHSFESCPVRFSSTIPSFSQHDHMISINQQFFTITSTHKYYYNANEQVRTFATQTTMCDVFSKHKNSEIGCDHKATTFHHSIERPKAKFSKPFSPSLTRNNVSYE